MASRSPGPIRWVAAHAKATRYYKGAKAKGWCPGIFVWGGGVTTEPRLAKTRLYSYSYLGHYLSVQRAHAGGTLAAPPPHRDRPEEHDKHTATHASKRAQAAASSAAAAAEA